MDAPHIIQLQRTENPDQIEIGTPGKGGCIKIHGDFNNLDDFKRRIDAAIEARRYANTRIETG